MYYTVEVIEFVKLTGSDLYINFYIFPGELHLTITRTKFQIKKNGF